MKRALVLSGGGARGAYQFGVWKALRKLNKRIDIVTGTSIGALNGCLIVQDDFNKAEAVWNNLSFSLVFDKEINIDYKKNTANLYKEYIKNFLKEGGMDVKNLEKLIVDSVNINKFYNSKIDFGLVTVKLNTLEPKMLTKKDIPKKKLADYLIASATCYPAFKTKKIENDTYVDGGYYDNLPINLAIDMGATEVIAVDLGTVGFPKKVKNQDILVKYIKPRNKINNFLVFDQEEAKRAIRIGYNDTLKEYNKLIGNKYTFTKFRTYINNVMMARKLHENISKHNNPKTKLGKFLKSNIYKNMITKDSKILSLEILEDLGRSFNIDDSYIYDIFTFHRLLIDNLNTTESLTKSNINKLLKEGNVSKVLESKVIIKYIYENINMNQDIVNIASLFPKEYMAAIYLYTIKKHN